MRNLGVRLPGEIHAALEAEARARGCSAAEVARAVLAEWSEGRTLAERLQALEGRVSSLEADALAVGKRTDVAADLAAHRAAKSPDLALKGVIHRPADTIDLGELARLYGESDDPRAPWRQRVTKALHAGWWNGWVLAPVRGPKGALLVMRAQVR